MRQVSKRHSMHAGEPLDRIDLHETEFHVATFCNVLCCPFPTWWQAFDFRFNLAIPVFFYFLFYCVLGNI